MSFNSKPTETHYDVLEVPETATGAEIKKAYRRLSLLHHPDKNPGKIDVSGKFQKINSAYEVIGDEHRRQEYDAERTSPFGGLNFNNQNMDELFANLFFGGMGGMGGPGGGAMPGFPPSRMHHINLNGGNPGQGFHQMHGFPPNANIKIFRNGTQMNFQPQMEKPSPIVKTVAISMEQVLNGGTIPVEIERWIIENNNKTFETEVLYVEIPKGVDDNEIIALKEKGNVVAEGCKGDIKIFIKVENTSVFKRSGLDLIIEKQITLKEALCGFSFELKHINGKNYVINNAAGSVVKPDFKKMIPGMGLERDGHRGGIIITFDIEFPDRLDEKVIEQLKVLL
jgi:DnaJ family protein A protein 2